MRNGNGRVDLLRNNLLGICSACALVALAVLAYSPARVVNADEGIRIESASSTVDLRSGHRTYSGKVTIVHENLELHAADVLEVRVNGKVERFEATGKPARFKQSAPYVHAIASGRAERMEYLASLRELKLWNYEVKDTDGNKQKGRFVTYRFK